VTAEFTGHSSRVLRALETETGKSFLFEGSEGLALDHFAITFQGTREEVEERALPFRQGDEVLVEIVEPHMYDEEDAVAKIDGYIISIAGAAAHVGSKRMVRIDQVGRTAASALLLDESGEVVKASPRPAGGKGERGGRRPSSSSGGGRAGERARTRARGRRAPADSEDAAARREAGLHESATTVDSEPEQESTLTARDLAETVEGGEGREDFREDKSQDDGTGDGLQSKPRRRGRRGGRRRSAAKAPATPE